MIRSGRVSRMIIIRPPVVFGFRPIHLMMAVARFPSGVPRDGPSDNAACHRASPAGRVTLYFLSPKGRRSVMRWQRAISVFSLIGVSATITALLPTSAAAVGIPRPNYQLGVVEANNAIPQAHALGVGWTRVPMPWAALEPAAGSWNRHYTQNDHQLLALAADGIVPVGVVETVPAWASINPAESPNGVPSGLYLPWNNPHNAWGQFMYQLARHYAGLINTWIIGNEISIHSGHAKSFDGTTAQMAEMIRIASLAVHAANPAAMVQAPGAPYWYTQGRTTNALLTDLAHLPGAARHHDFINGLNLHLYNTVQWNGMIYAQYRQMLKRHGLGFMPIWLSETNAAPGAPEDPGVTPAEQADFLIENLSSSLGYASHVEVYKMTGGSQVNDGLLNATGVPGPAYTAVQTLSRALYGTKFLHQSVLGYQWKAVSKPAVVTFGGVKRSVTVVWDQGFRPTVVTLTAYAPRALVITATGASHIIGASHGHFILKLAPALHHSLTPPTNAPIGGPPLIVVQSLRLGQAGTPVKLPANSPAEFAGPAHPLVAHYGTESAQVNPDSATLVIATGSHTVLAGGWGTASGDLLGPSGVAIGPSGTVYVANSGAQDVVAYAPSGQVVATWGVYGSRPGQFNGPSGIAVGPDGRVYVADTLNQRIEAFLPRGSYLGQVYTPWPGAIHMLGAAQLQVTQVMTGHTSTIPAP